MVEHRREGRREAPACESGIADGATTSRCPTLAEPDRHLWRVLLLLLALSTPACDECDSEDAHCDGNVAVWCGTHNNMTRTPRLQSENCAASRQVCVALPKESSVFCAVSASPDPRCPSGRDDLLCDENTAIACHKGYLTGAVECGSDVCVTSDDPNFQDGCRDPQSVCFGQPDRWVCDVHEAIRCTQMFIDDAESCADCTVGADGKLFSQFNGQKCGF